MSNALWCDPGGHAMSEHDLAASKLDKVVGKSHGHWTFRGYEEGYPGHPEFLHTCEEHAPADFPNAEWVPSKNWLDKQRSMA